jgi:hypothetical protein
MEAGHDCLRCHDGTSARRWTAAGTFWQGAHITLTDSAGTSFTLRGNQVGNFYTAEPLVFPLTVTVEGRTMTDPATYGGCNRCHGLNAAASGAIGPLMAPGQDCLPCHDGATAKRWTVAGTWTPDAVVTVTDTSGQAVSLVGNQAGNFYTDAPLAFPLTAVVNGQQMPAQVTYGGCNKCHTSPSASPIGSTGPLMLPGQDCMSCHGPGGVATAKFSAAGTFRPGQTVRVAGYSMVTNSAGNFYFYANTSPISFATPQPASVNGASMEGGASSGGCNRCHGGGQNPG